MGNTQNDLFDTVIAAGVKAIIHDNARVDTLVAAVQQAKDGGRPSFLIDCEITVTGVAVRQIVSNNAMGARRGVFRTVRDLAARGLARCS